MSTGTFDYQNRTGSRVMSYVILALTAGITLLVRMMISNAIVIIASFFGVLILLSTLGVFVNRWLFIHEASYELTPQKLTIHAGKQEIVLTPAEVNGVGCDPIYDKQSKGTDTVKCWKLSILTIHKNYEFFSDNVLERDENNRISIRQFQTFGRELKHWVGMLE